MNNELLPCPFCGGEVGFHKDEDCNGCHYIWCHSCDGMFDLSTKADPENDTETLDELNERIAPIWNNRAQQSAPAGYVLVPVEPVANQLIKGMADALRHALKELDTETPEDIDYGQLYSALSAYEAFKVEPVQEPVATIQSQDPYDERVGVYFALGDMARLSALPAGTKLYAAPQPVSDDVALLRKQLDEANSAYARLADGVPAAMAKYHKCKKQLDEALGLLEGYRWKDIEINNFVENADETSRIPQQVEERVLQG